MKYVWVDGLISQRRCGALVGQLCPCGGHLQLKRVPFVIHMLKNISCTAHTPGNGESIWWKQTTDDGFPTKVLCHHCEEQSGRVPDIPSKGHLQMGSKGFLNSFIMCLVHSPPGQPALLDPGTSHQISGCFHSNWWSSQKCNEQHHQFLLPPDQTSTLKHISTNAVWYPPWVPSLFLRMIYEQKLTCIINLIWVFCGKCYYRTLV